MILSPFVKVRLRATYGSAVLIGLIVLCALAPPSLAEDDFGTLVVTLNRPTLHGAPTTIFYKYDLYLQNLDQRSTVKASWATTLFKAPSNDLASDGEDGTVRTLTLRAGRYGVTYYELWAGVSIYYPKGFFLIPFTIRPGRATYIGSYQPVGDDYNGVLGMPTLRGAHFVISDESARDVPIARAKNASLGPVDVDVFDVDQLKNPLLSMGQAR